MGCLTAIKKVNILPASFATLLVCIPPSIEAGPAYPKIPAGFAGIADLLRVLEHSKLALNVAVFVRHEYFFHPKSGKLQEVSRESVHVRCQSIWVQGRLKLRDGLTHLVDIIMRQHCKSGDLWLSKVVLMHKPCLGGCTNWPRRSTRLRRDGKVVRAWHLDNDGCLITHLSFIS